MSDPWDTYERWFDYWNLMREQWRNAYQEVENVINNPRDYSPRPYSEHLPITIRLAEHYKAKLEEILNRLMLSKPLETDTKEEALEKLGIHAELTMLDVEISTHLLKEEDFV